MEPLWHTAAGGLSEVLFVLSFLFDTGSFTHLVFCHLLIIVDCWILYIRLHELLLHSFAFVLFIVLRLRGCSYLLLLFSSFAIFFFLFYWDSEQVFVYMLSLVPCMWDCVVFLVGSGGQCCHEPVWGSFHTRLWSEQVFSKCLLVHMSNVWTCVFYKHFLLSYLAGVLLSSLDWSTDRYITVLTGT